MAVIGAVHDLSGVGRCSLTAAISILSAMGHHCCPLPTAVLSNQTGFQSYTYLDFTSEMPAYLRQWDALGLRPDMIYTGFLGSEAQPALLAEYVRTQKDALVVVDPVMGDNGALYPCYGMGMVEQMRKLVAEAHVITPNLTEFLLLCGEEDLKRPVDGPECLTLAAKLNGSRLETVIITGFVQRDSVRNLILDLKSGRTDVTQNAYTGISYSGTGDVFAAVFCGLTAGGARPLEATEQAAEFVSRATAEMDPASDPRYGIHYEKYLYRLMDPKHGKGSLQ